jgi:hypothetical protein
MPLFRRIDEKNAAERPERLTPEGLFGLLIDDDDFLPGFGEFRRCDKAGQPPANNDPV